MKEGAPGANQPGGKVGDLFGRRKAPAGGAAGDSFHHLGSHMGSGGIRRDQGFDPRDEEPLPVSAQLAEKSLKGADPETGREIAVGPMSGEGGEEKEQRGPDSKTGPEMVKKKDQGSEGRVRGGYREVGRPAKGRMGKEGKARKRRLSKGLVKIRKGLCRVLEIPGEIAKGRTVGKGVPVSREKNRSSILGKLFCQIVSRLSPGSDKEMCVHQGMETDDQSLGKVVRFSAPDSVM